MDHVPYGTHNPRGKTTRESVLELHGQGYTLGAIRSELGLTKTGTARASRWIAEAACSIVSTKGIA